jgi:hypothetical protein
MRKAASYICEHSAEYTLVPKLKKILKKKFEFVTPIYPWLSREGSKVSHNLHKKDEFYAVALYPRRPKIPSIDPIEIEIKINPELIKGARVGSEHGIPVIAGCPLATNFWCLGDEPEFLWMKINDDCKEIHTAKATKSNKWSIIDNSKNSIFKSEEQLLEFVSENKKMLNLKRFIEAVRDFHYRSSHSFWVFGGRYKPVYFLLK